MELAHVLSSAVEEGYVSLRNVKLKLTDNDSFMP